MGEALGAPNLSAFVTRVYTAHIPINLDLGMSTDSLPYFEAKKVKGKGAINKLKTITFACFLATGHRTALPP